MIPASAAQVVPTSEVLRAIRDNGDIGTPFGFRIERADDRTPETIVVYATDGILYLNAATMEPYRVSALYSLPVGWDLPDTHKSLDAYPTSV